MLQRAALELRCMMLRVNESEGGKEGRKGRAAASEGKLGDQARLGPRSSLVT